jgi:Fe-S-cluster formation regulator IscX/YfhJ
MDISKETDVTKLKALLSDQRDVVDQAQMNCQIIRQRIQELEKVDEDTVVAKPDPLAKPPKK